MLLIDVVEGSAHSASFLLLTKQWRLMPCLATTKKLPTKRKKGGYESDSPRVLSILSPLSFLFSFTSCTL